jgi:uncharacterized protein
MRRKEREITDPKRIEAILDSARICRIGLVDGNAPYVVPVCFGYRDNAVYFHCATAGRKLDILRKNPRVCVEAESDAEFLPDDRPCGWGLRYTSVIGVGVAVILEEPGAKRRGLGILMAHYTEGPFVFPDGVLARTAVVRIDMESWTGKASGFKEESS